MGEGSTHKPFFASLASFSNSSIARRLLPIPPAPAVFDQRVIDVGPIGQTHLGKDAPRPIAAVGLEDDVFPED
jgi:hypothetical protein